MVYNIYFWRHASIGFPSKVLELTPNLLYSVNIKWHSISRGGNEMSSYFIASSKGFLFQEEKAIEVNLRRCPLDLREFHRNGREAEYIKTGQPVTATIARELPFTEQNLLKCCWEKLLSLQIELVQILLFCWVYFMVNQKFNIWYIFEIWIWHAESNFGVNRMDKTIVAKGQVSNNISF